MDHNTIILAITLLIAFISIFRKSKKANNDDNSPPLFPGHLPILGHIHLVRNADGKYIWRCIKRGAEIAWELGGVVRMKIPFFFDYLISDPEDSWTILNTSLEKHYIVAFMNNYFGEGLITAPEKRWRKHRKLIGPAFAVHNLGKLLPMINSQAKAIADEWKTKVDTGPFNPRRYLSVAFIRTILGYNYSFSVPEYEKAIATIFKVINKRIVNVWYHFDFIFNQTKSADVYRDAVNILKRANEEIITTCINNNHKAGDGKAVETTDESYKGILNYMVTECGFTNEELTDELNTMITAGYDSTSTTLTFVLIMLGTYQDIQEKVYKELKTVLTSPDEDVGKEDLAKLVYLEAVIKETQRHYPIAPFIIRYNDKDVKLKKYTIPANSYFLVNAYAMNCHPLWGKDRLEFNPDRWLDPSRIPKNCFYGFSVGKRDCVGKNYSMMVMKVMMLNLIKKYRVFADEKNLVVSAVFTAAPQSGFEISLELRK